MRSGKSGCTKQDRDERTESYQNFLHSLYLLRLQFYDSLCELFVDSSKVELKDHRAQFRANESRINRQATGFKGEIDRAIALIVAAILAKGITNSTPQ